MANYIPYTNPYATNPSTYGLTQTTNSQGYTRYVDAQGNGYTQTPNGFQPDPSFKSPAGSSAPSTATAPTPATPAATPSSTPSGGVQATGFTTNGNSGGTQNFTYNGRQYSMPTSYGQSPTQAQMLAYAESQGASAPAAPGSIPGVTGNLGPGSTGAQVKALQTWLVSQGYLTQAQMDTGPGTYGPQTTRAVAAWQQANNIDTQGNPGYFGPISQAFIASNGAGGAVTGTGGAGTGTGGATGGTGGTGPTPTGNAQLDTIQKQLQALLDSNKAAIPAGLQITPVLTQQFLAWAHQVVDPQTQQLINQHITSINSDLAQRETDFQNSQAETLQQFGTNLATEQNQAGASGTAFSGQRNLNERNMAASTNRTLASLAADTQNQVGQELNAGAAQVGASNAGRFTIPSLTGASVGIEGGSRGSSGSGNSLNFNYNPSNYTMGTDISTGNTNVANQQANYLTQYGTLAGNNSARSMQDLIGGVTGLPAGYTVPAGLT